MEIKTFDYNPGIVCTRCIMDDTVKGIVFDSDGVCTFCNIHDELEEKYPLNSESTLELQKLAEKIIYEGNGKKYDCIVGVSGGRDSTYTLYNAVKLGLRPLAVHFDNGWNSEIAVQNIKNACEILNIDLHTHVANWEEFKDLQRSFLFASVPDAEVPTDWIIFSVLFAEAVQYKVKYIVHGHSFRTEGTTPLSWTYMDGRYVKDVQNKFGKSRQSSFPNMGIFKYIYYSVIKRIRQIRLLYYIPYNEKEVMEMLENKLGWRNYGDKHHESKYTAFFQAYILTRKFGIDKRKLHYSAKVRNHQISRAEALKVIEKDPYNSGSESMKYCLKKLDLNYEEFDQIMNSPVKSFRDYKSYFSIIKKLQYPLYLGYKMGIIPDTVFKKYFNFIL